MTDRNVDDARGPRSIREPGTSPRALRPLPPPPPGRAAAGRDQARGDRDDPARPDRDALPRPARPKPESGARPTRARPDPNPMRLMLGFAGIASVSAITAALLPSVAPAAVADAATITTTVADAVPQPTPVHVTHYVVLEPGQTAPPQATVKVQPTPTPIVRVQVVTRTRQSGTP